MIFKSMLTVKKAIRSTVQVLLFFLSLILEVNRKVIIAVTLCRLLRDISFIILKKKQQTSINNFFRQYVDSTNVKFFC